MHVDRDIFKNALDAIIIVNNAGSVLEVNPTAINLIKKRKGKITGQPLITFFDGDLTKERGEVMLKNDDAKAIDKEIILEYTKAEGTDKDKYLYFFRDISEFKLEIKRREHFLGIAGHELKNPLAAIKALDQMLLRSKKIKGDEFLETQLKKIDSKADTLTKLIKELLDITKIKHDTLGLNIKRVRFNSILDDVVEDFTRTETAHKVVVHNPTDVYINADPERIAQVIINLLKNGAKYSPNSDMLFVNVEKRKKYLICEVIDFGIGIPANELGNIFKLYYRLPDREYSFAGLGVGLYIAREIIKAHGGKMKVKSELGYGSQFNFYLPLKQKIKNGQHTISRR